MTAHEFLISKNVVSLKETYSVYEIQRWLEQYGDVVLSIAAEKAETNKNKASSWKEVSVDKSSILNCLKE